MKSGLLLFPPEEEAGFGGRIGSVGLGARTSFCLRLEKEPGTPTPRGLQAWLLLCFPSWDVGENDKYLLSAIPNSTPLPSRVSFLTYDVLGFFFVCGLPSLMRAATFSVLFLPQLLQCHLSHSWYSINIWCMNALTFSYFFYSLMFTTTW